MDYIKLNTLKLDSNAHIINVLSNHIDMVNKSSGFQTAVEQLNTNQKKLEKLYTLLRKDINDTEKAKNEIRISLLKIVSPVITIMQIFAYDNNKKNLAKRLESISSEYLQNCTDLELINISKKLWMSANKFGGYSLAFINKSSIFSEKLKSIQELEKNYGLIPDMIKNIESENIKFIEALLHYNEELDEKVKTVRKIKKTSNKIDSLLKNRIDRFVLLCEYENSEFYKNYQEARENQKRIPVSEEKSSDSITDSTNNPDEKKVRQVKPRTHVRAKSTEPSTV